MMNVVDRLTLQLESLETREKELLLRKANPGISIDAWERCLDELDEVTVEIDSTMHELHAAQERSQAHKQAWKDTHPTLASIWPGRER